MRRIDGNKRDGMTLDEIGALLGVCRERVRQLETQALKKLRLLLEKEGWTRDDIVELFSKAP